MYNAQNMCLLAGFLVNFYAPSLQPALTFQQADDTRNPDSPVLPLPGSTPTRPHMPFSAVLLFGSPFSRHFFHDYNPLHPSGRVFLESKKLPVTEYLFCAEERETPPTQKKPKKKCGPKKGVNDGADGEDGKETGKGPKTQLQRNVAAALRTKKVFTENMSSATNLLATISTKIEWAWADHTHVKKPLLDAQAAVQAAVTPFSQDFVVLEMRDLKKKFGEAVMVAETNRMTEALDGLLKTLGGEIKRLLAMHRAQLMA